MEPEPFCATNDERVRRAMLMTFRDLEIADDNSLPLLTLVLMVDKEPGPALSVLSVRVRDGMHRNRRVFSVRQRQFADEAMSYDFGPYWLVLAMPIRRTVSDGTLIANVAQASGEVEPVAFTVQFVTPYFAMSRNTSRCAVGSVIHVCSLKTACSECSKLATLGLLRRWLNVSRPSASHAFTLREGGKPANDPFCSTQRDPPDEGLPGTAGQCRSEPQAARGFVEYGTTATVDFRDTRSKQLTLETSRTGARRKEIAVAVPASTSIEVLAMIVVLRHIFLGVCVIALSSLACSIRPKRRSGGNIVSMSASLHSLVGSASVKNFFNES